MSGRGDWRGLENNFTKLGLDTNIFIYFFDRESPFHSIADKLFKDIVEKGRQIVTSTITLTELLSFRKVSKANIKRLEESIYSMPALSLVDVDKTIAIDAARIRR